MRKYIYWLFKIMWTCLSFFIGNYIRITHDTGLAIFILIVVPLLIVGDLLAERYIKAKKRFT